MKILNSDHLIYMRMPEKYISIKSNTTLKLIQSKIRSIFFNKKVNT